MIGAVILSSGMGLIPVVQIGSPGKYRDDVVWLKEILSRLDPLRY